MNLSGSSEESMRAEADLSEAVAAQFGPSAFAGNEVGMGDTILGHGEKRTSSAKSAMKTCRFWGVSDNFSEHFE